eukprot:324463-Chlamydomonas_euryale.AAC.5
MSACAGGEQQEQRRSGGTKPGTRNDRRLASRARRKPVPAPPGHDEAAAQRRLRRRGLAWPRRRADGAEPAAAQRCGNGAYARSPPNKACRERFRQSRLSCRGDEGMERRGRTAGGRSPPLWRRLHALHAARRAVPAAPR